MEQKQMLGEVIYMKIASYVFSIISPRSGQ
jgi:hypothetical protein